MSSIQPFHLVLILSALGFIPLAVVMTTSFTKIAVVMMLLRNALGVPQIPPNIALYALSLILSAYVMAPALQHGYAVLASSPEAFVSVDAFIDTAARAFEPVRDFLARNTRDQDVDFFVSAAARLWPPELAADVGRRDLFVLVPAFAVTELTTAFQIGFLLYLPFVVIDLVVQSVLLALGMMMMSPMTISLPLKLLIFVLVEGWSKLISSLVLSYA